MHCQLGYLKNHNQIIIKSIDLSDNSVQSKILPISDIENEKFNTIFYTEEQ